MQTCTQIRKKKKIFLKWHTSLQTTWTAVQWTHVWRPTKLSLLARECKAMQGCAVFSCRLSNPGTDAFVLSGVQSQLGGGAPLETVVLSRCWAQMLAFQWTVNGRSCSRAALWPSWVSLSMITTHTRTCKMTCAQYLTQSSWICIKYRLERLSVRVYFRVSAMAAGTHVLSPAAVLYWCFCSSHEPLIFVCFPKNVHLPQ